MKNKTVGLFGKYGEKTAQPVLLEVKAILESMGAEVLLGDTTSSDVSGKRLMDHPEAMDQLNFAVVVGGDGTMLHAARALAKHQIPIIGVNLGQLGFLTDIPSDKVKENFQAIADDDFYIEYRAMLKTEIYRDGVVCFSSESLNETVISKGDTGKLIEFSIDVDDIFVSRTRSDGLIIATPTGSTAYALSAGGPIAEPTLPVTILVPLCPHTLSNRPIILDKNSTIRISQFELGNSHAALAIDGIIQQRLRGDETIIMTSSEHRMPLMRINHHNHFTALRSKLGWYS